MKHAIRFAPLFVAFAALGAAATFSAAGVAPWWIVVFGVILPDLSFLAAIGTTPTEPGLMPVRVVGPYNVLHHLGMPTLLLTLGVVAAEPSVVALALAWASHILWDRGVGYRRRLRNGSIEPLESPKRTITDLISARLRH